jgi:hypothetical protein
VATGLPVDNYEKTFSIADFCTVVPTCFKRVCAPVHSQSTELLDLLTIPKLVNQLDGPSPVYVPVNITDNSRNVIRQEYVVTVSEFYQFSGLRELKFISMSSRISKFPTRSSKYSRQSFKNRKSIINLVRILSEKAPALNDQRSTVFNPTCPAFRATQNNKSNQGNPNNFAYHSTRAGNRGKQ